VEAEIYIQSRISSKTYRTQPNEYTFDHGPFRNTQKCAKRVYTSFYLNFEDTHAQSLSAEAEEIGRLAEQVFKLPHEEKVKYAFGSSSTTIFGYDDKTLLPT